MNAFDCCFASGIVFIARDLYVFVCDWLTNLNGPEPMGCREKSAAALAGTIPAADGMRFHKKEAYGALR